jgi:hypothetical protein
LTPLVIIKSYKTFTFCYESKHARVKETEREDQQKERSVVENYHCIKGEKNRGAMKRWLDEEAMGLI